MNPFSVHYWMPDDDADVYRAREAALDADDELGRTYPQEAHDPAFHAELCSKRYIQHRKTARATQNQLTYVAKRVDATANRGMFVVLAGFAFLVAIDVLGNQNAWHVVQSIFGFIGKL